MSNEIKTDVEEPKVCPICGYVDGAKPTVSEEVKRSYLLSVLKEEPFTHVYELYDGAVTLTYAANRGKITSAIQSALRAAGRDLDRAERTRVQTEINAAVTLRSVECMVDGRSKVLFSQNADDIGEDIPEHVEKFKMQLSESLDQLLQLEVHELAAMFDTLIFYLTRKGLDQNFWKGVGVR